MYCGLIFRPYHFPLKFCKNVQIFVKVIGIVVVVVVEAETLLVIEAFSRDITYDQGS